MNSKGTQFNVNNEELDTMEAESNLPVNTGYGRSSGNVCQMCESVNPSGSTTCLYCGNDLLSDSMVQQHIDARVSMACQKGAVAAMRRSFENNQVEKTELEKATDRIEELNEKVAALQTALENLEADKPKGASAEADEKEAENPEKTIDMKQMTADIAALAAETTAVLALVDALEDDKDGKKKKKAKKDPAREAKIEELKKRLVAVQETAQKLQTGAVEETTDGEDSLEMKDVNALNKQLIEEVLGIYKESQKAVSETQQMEQAKLKLECELAQIRLEQAKLAGEAKGTVGGGTGAGNGTGGNGTGGVNNGKGSSKSEAEIARDRVVLEIKKKFKKGGCPAWISPVIGNAEAQVIESGLSAANFDAYPIQTEKDGYENYKDVAKALNAERKRTNTNFSTAVRGLQDAINAMAVWSKKVSQNQNADGKAELSYKDLCYPIYVEKVAGKYIGILERAKLFSDKNKPRALTPHEREFCYGYMLYGYESFYMGFFADDDNRELLKAVEKACKKYNTAKDDRALFADDVFAPAFQK